MKRYSSYTEKRDAKCKKNFLRAEQFCKTLLLLSRYTSAKVFDNVIIALQLIRKINSAISFAKQRCMYEILEELCVISRETDGLSQKEKKQFLRLLLDLYFSSFKEDPFIFQTVLSTEHYK